MLILCSSSDGMSFLCYAPLIAFIHSFLTIIGLNKACRNISFLVGV